MDYALVFVKGLFEKAHRNISALDWVEQKTRRVLEMDKWHHIQCLVSFKLSRKGFILVAQKLKWFELWYLPFHTETYPRATHLTSIVLNDSENFHFICFLFYFFTGKLANQLSYWEFNYFANFNQLLKFIQDLSSLSRDHVVVFNFPNVHHKQHYLFMKAFLEWILFSHLYSILPIRTVLIFFCIHVFLP